MRTTNKWSATIALLTVLLTGTGQAAPAKSKDANADKPASSCCAGCDCTPTNK